MTLFACNTGQVACNTGQANKLYTQAMVRNLIEREYRTQNIERDPELLAKQLMRQMDVGIASDEQSPNGTAHQLTLVLLTVLEGLQLALKDSDAAIVMDILGLLLRDLKRNQQTYQLKLLDAVTMEHANRRFRESQKQHRRTTYQQLRSPAAG